MTNSNFKGNRPDYKATIDLKKFNGSFVSRFNDNQDYLCIPLGMNPSLYLRKDEKTGEDTVTVQVSFFKKDKQTGRATHSISVDLGERHKEFANITKEQKKAYCPTIGSFYPPQENTPQAQPQGGFTPQGGYAPQPQMGYAPQPQGGYAPQGGYPQQPVSQPAIAPAGPSDDLPAGPAPGLGNGGYQGGYQNTFQNKGF